MTELKGLKGAIVECVPNFSEGREPHIIRSIANEIGSIANVKVLDIHSDSDHNRSVITFAGRPNAVVDAAVAGVRAASRLIDLNRHRGVHPRLGAADVVPFVPIRDIDMDACVTLARTVASKVWNDLGIPTYLYGEAALREDRKGLEKVRLGGFEQLRGLVENDSSKAPDNGGPSLHPTAGATIIGARHPLIAYNVDLDSKDLEAAKAIASSIRESCGGLAGVKALGLHLESKSCVQVSTNITRPDLTSPFQVFERIREEAQRKGINVIRSELVGLMPVEAAISSVRHAMRFEHFDEGRIIEFNL